ncbi:hypothetical protein BDA96_07G042800 [Sorghum bicolor]|uniref:Embryo surrounding factor 1 brassicaceae domain-containing protein n=2 Tax=Sorghum bicolor TaxID=4558 RepID=C5YGU8_SORBI|nr:hypothetical protein SORBI_3007G040500 [Sorghum bicolor]KAG0522503.1 hypothetical protein BDA96_07G042800 [Sorghum bicolor]
MAKFLNYTSVQGLLMLSMVLLASCVIHAHIISGEAREVSNTGIATMTTMVAPRKIIADNKNLLCYLKGILYCCDLIGKCWHDIMECWQHCHGRKV